MKDLVQTWQTFFEQFGFRGLATIFSALIAGFGGLQLIWKLGGKLWQAWQQRRLLKDLHPFYTKVEIQRATRYYVETKCQTVAPSRHEEPGHTFAFTPRETSIPFFLKKAFHPTNKDDCQFYMILADSGMGKTTFLINLYLRYINQFSGSAYKIKLFPLAYPNIDAEITTIPDAEKRQTILLLDAFDEDAQALENYTARLHDLIQMVMQFREVVITCRTQFFPTEEDEPRESGVLRFGPEGGARVFYKLYLSPFDDADIRTYLRKRFGWWQWLKKRKARQIVLSCPSLMVRPMLLSHIEDLLHPEQPYTATYQVYAELIHKWIEREALKVTPERRKRYEEELFDFSRAIARDIYRHRNERQGALLIPGANIQAFADTHGIKLNEMEMKSRSLLNRNALGHYKFSHKSILEYFLAEEAFFNAEFRAELDFDGMDQAETFFQEMIFDQLTAPFFERSGLRGEYSLTDGKTRPLPVMNAKTLAGVTMLQLPEGLTADDAFLLKGLRNLRCLDLGPTTTPAAAQQLQQLLPACQILRYVSDAEVLDLFGVTPQQVEIKNQAYTVGRPMTYLQNDYAEHGETVVDRATGLTWQQSGSRKPLTYADAQAYIRKLNQQKFAGFDNWRLPTIPELMSLLEPTPKHGDLYIDPIFDKTQCWCWSADLRRKKDESSSESAWFVYFDVGNVGWSRLGNVSYVRAVRS